MPWIAAAQTSSRKGIALSRTNKSRRSAVSLRRQFVQQWRGCAVHQECTLHQVAPYIGKMKSSMARALISGFTRAGDTIYDGFCGSGTIALEAWILNRNIIANDMSPYATLVTRSKLFPPPSSEDAFDEIRFVEKRAKLVAPTIDLRFTPKWVRQFFHPETLREILAWVKVLKARRSHFLLSCLMGILHHQRPGFLSYPSSHTVPYLRTKKFPRKSHAELYEYRPVRQRLERKVLRTLKRVPSLDATLSRETHMRDTGRFLPRRSVDAIITSPPYMRQLDYGRDNRLRLSFLGTNDWSALDDKVSPPEAQFFKLLRSSLRSWHKVLAPRGVCVLVVGDTFSRLFKMSLPDALVQLATEDVGGYSSYLETLGGHTDEEARSSGLSRKLERNSPRFPARSEPRWLKIRRVKTYI